MKFILTNDDGIDAPGIAVLRRAVEGLGEYHVYAPVEAHSGCSHKLTVDGGIRIEKRGDRETAVHGTPGDCVRLALHQMGRVDWILSGVNEGGNLGVDVFYSGTVAAVREGVFHQTPGIAFSHYIRKGLKPDWNRVEVWTRDAIRNLTRHPLPVGMLYSVNFPHLDPSAAEPGVVECALDTNPLPLVFREQDTGHVYAGVYSERPRTPGSDVDVCFGGNIAVTRLSTCHGSNLVTALS